MSGCCDENIFRLDVAVEEVVCMDVLQTLHNLIQDALDAAVVQTLVVTSLHQLIQVSLHILHGDVKLLGEGIEEDIKSWDEMRSLSNSIIPQWNHSKRVLWFVSHD